ncbi:MAG: HEAT repeat domain-containing protein, partial [Acidobacteriaceae bacterium]
MINMSNPRSLQSLVLRNALHLVLGFTLLPCAVYGQATKSQSDEVTTSIARAKSGDVGVRDVEIIAAAGVVEAVPALEEQFKRATDVKTKAKIASGLVRLGDKDNTYWNYLLEQARVVVDSDIPDAFFSDSQGKGMDHQFSPELKAWAQAHNVDVNTAGIDSVYDYPVKVLLLGETGDPRGVPLLRRALQARDGFIVTAAAKGLAQVQDKDSIPLLIAAARSAHAGIASEIAKALIYFDDPDAQSA